MPPTFIELGTFRNEPFAQSEQAYVTAVLQQATDAVWVTTGLDEYPTDQRASRITRYAIMDFSLWLMSQQEHRDEINSPFSSERIGSYSYQKMQQASRGEETGIYWLDMLFAMLLSSSDSGATVGLVDSERVFNPEGYTYAQQREADKRQTILHDPSAFHYWTE